MGHIGYGCLDGEGQAAEPRAHLGVCEFAGLHEALTAVYVEAFLRNGAL